MSPHGVVLNIKSKPCSSGCHTADAREMLALSSALPLLVSNAMKNMQVCAGYNAFSVLFLGQN